MESLRQIMSQLCGKADCLRGALCAEEMVINMNLNIKLFSRFQSCFVKVVCSNKPGHRIS